jgi:thiamine biosynthesis lipoprotein
MNTVDRAFTCMGSRMRIMADHATDDAVCAERKWLDTFDRQLSRFLWSSELSRLNRDHGRTVRVSPLLASAVAAAVWAAERTGGLVDPTLLGQLEAAGYRETRDGAAPAPLADAIACAPVRVAARPSARRAWRDIAVDVRAGAVTLGHGLRLDLGGTAKGLAADAVALRLLRRHRRFAVDCGGDLRVFAAPGQEPFRILVEHPLTGEHVGRIDISDGAVATSGLGARVWRNPDGAFAHHLLDPSTGRCAWTGLLSATAIAPTALEAEALAKAALLSGPNGASRWLARYGGVVVDDHGDVHLVGA